jgi:serine/threonine protein phosphatase PrpC
MTISAVMDGCSSGNESYFASALVGKIIKKIAVEEQYKNWLNPNELLSLPLYLKKISQQVFNNLLNIKNQLLLEQFDLLSTILLLITDKQNKNAILLALGDGLVCCDGILEEFEADNKPDYIGYHLNENFDSWYDLQKIRTYNHFKDISICSDGIFTFAHFDNEKYPLLDVDIVQYLLKDSSDSDNKEILKKKIRYLAKQYGLAPTDDLAIIRIIAK